MIAMTTTMIAGFALLITIIVCLSTVLVIIVLHVFVLF